MDNEEVRIVPMYRGCRGCIAVGNSKRCAHLDECGLDIYIKNTPEAYREYLTIRTKHKLGVKEDG